MRYKRDESFRYSFGVPLPASFRITKMGNEYVVSSIGEAEIIDISPGGLRLKSQLKFPDKPLELAVTFVMNGKELSYDGKVVWKKQVGNTYNYGLHLQIDDDDKRVLIEELKVFSKNAIED